jgi:gamma-soluble NSF attachment protein
VQTLESLLQAYDDEDPDLARRALASPFIRHMDVEYARLSRDLKLPKGMSTAPKAAIVENAAASYVSQSAANAGESSGAAAPRPADDDEEEGGLC